MRPLAIALLVVVAACDSAPSAGIGNGVASTKTNDTKTMPGATMPGAMPSTRVDATDLIEKFQCARCHDIPNIEPAPEHKHCVGCHQAIHAGTFAAKKVHLERWKKRITSMLWAPSLEGADRLRRSWVQSFLLTPHDVRPGLVAEMPRLAITPDEAARLAAHLVPDEAARLAAHLVPNDAAHLAPDEAAHFAPDAVARVAAHFGTDEAAAYRDAKDATDDAQLASCGWGRREAHLDNDTIARASAAWVRDNDAIVRADSAVSDSDAPVRPDDIARGEELFRSLACARCHRFTGSPVDDADLHVKGRTQVGPLDGAWALAPDLRFARVRMTAASMATWIEKPRGAMPKLGVNAENARLLAVFIANARIVDANLNVSIAANSPITDANPLAPIAEDSRVRIANDRSRSTIAGENRSAMPSRLPVLTRAVTYDEVEKRVFHNVCWHCHAVPDFARGDGGPGNSGGFGFAPRGLDLSSYEGIASGSLDEKGERRSVFGKMADGTPRLVAHLMARYVEEAGGSVEGVRGMPLGLPPLPLEEVQLVESWIAQGRPR